MNVGQKVNQIKADLSKIVGICNEAEDFGAAQQAQSALTTVAACSTQLKSSGTGTSDIEFK